MPFHRPIFLMSMLAAAMAVDGAAHADGNHPDAARAEALFAEARRLMTAGDYAAACPKFADSQAIDPAPGTALNLATCYEKQGKLASAWATFRTAQAEAQTAKQADRARAASKHADALEPSLSRLAIAVAPTAQVRALEIRCDGEIVRDAEWGVPIPRDGGTHEIEATAPGKKPWKTRVELAASKQTLSVDVPALEDEAPAAPPPAAVAAGPTPAGGATSTLLDASPSERPAGQVQRIAGLVVGGVGVVVVGVGAFAGLTALSTYNQATVSCGTPPLCPKGSAAFSQRASASNWATVSNVTFAVGGALLAGGAVLFLTAPKGNAAPAVGFALTPGGGSVALVRTF